MRELSAEGLKVIGRGTTAVVYEYENDKVLKVYIEGWPLEEIIKEKERTEAVYSLGINCPRVYDIVKVAEGYGLIYEKAGGETMSKVLQSIGDEDRENRLKSFVLRLTDRMKSIHAVPVTEGILPDIKAFYMDKIDNVFAGYLDAGRIAQMKAIVDSVPDTVGFVHGDMNVSNISSAPEGKIIDVADACQGNPLFDINIYPGFCYLGRYNSDAFEKHGVNAEEMRLITDMVFDSYYGDLPAEEKAQKLRLYWKLGAVRLFVSLDAAHLLNAMPGTVLQAMAGVLDEDPE